MSSIDIRHIVFDIGKVLIHYDPHLPYCRIIPDEAERNWFFANVCTQDWNVEQDRGRSWKEAEALLIQNHPEREEHIRAFRRHWHEMVPHAYVGTVSIMESLITDGRDVTMLTNFASDTFREAQQLYPFLTLPRGVTVSGDVGLIKPDVAIYSAHAKTFDLIPEATLFIDDSMANVEGAKAAGWQAVHFTDPQKLRVDLAAYGVHS
ncbi:HAD family phosphatase [Sinorhizobium numidicum]|uniref:HAD family phosphatase n=1 Tax=Sinorhizobium numidicum TaxID=680248 RepID=A0ABY8D3J9_9HYPH|nr:HAD family phosphatase [Sinorhizobium numidicum]WEX78278.1 HAD family phosphatase [Sinorhizobium numidicum]WEX84937.1 HAD family phosphatase [Sinorhizobium numidicum]